MQYWTVLWINPSNVWEAACTNCEEGQARAAAGQLLAYGNQNVIAQVYDDQTGTTRTFDFVANDWTSGTGATAPPPAPAPAPAPAQGISASTIVATIGLMFLGGVIVWSLAQD